MPATKHIGKLCRSILSVLALAGCLTAEAASTGATVNVPSSWSSRGVGAGGALYAPSISPANTNEYFLSCDMSEVFHSTDFGNSYSVLPADMIQGGHYSAIRFTSDPKVLYSLTYANGNYAMATKSLDGGATWQVLAGDPLPNDDKYSIWADSNRTDRVILSGYSDIYASTDGGQSFKLVYSAKSSSLGVVIGGAYFDQGKVYLGTSDGLLYSPDGGSTFSNVGNPGIPAGESIASFVGARSGSKLRFFALTGAAGSVYPMDAPGGDYYGFIRGIYSLDDATGSWVPRMTGIDISKDFLQYLAMATNDVNTVYAGGSDSGNAPEIMVTTDAGLHWTNTFHASQNANIATGWTGDGGDRDWSYGEVVYGLAVAPTDSSRAVFTDMGFAHVTANGGTSWRQAYVSPADQHPAGLTSIAKQSYHSVGLENTSAWQVFWADANTLFAAYSDIRAIRSVDGGATWSFNYAGLNANTTYRIVQDPGTKKLYAGTSDIHDLYQSTRLQASPLDNNDSHGDILTSSDKGATWSILHHFGHPVFWLVIDPSRPSRMYASVVHSTLGGVFVTDDLQNGANATWTRLANPSRAIGHPASLAVLNDGSLIATFSGQRTANGFTATSGVFSYNPTSATWQDLSDPGMYYWTKDIVIDPNDSAQNTWYVGVFSGWGGAANGLGGLYRTSDRGLHWNKISSLDRVTSITINPQHADDAYLTTEYEGLWHTADIHAPQPTFSRVNSYPFKQPERVFFNPYDASQIWISSFGNGIKVGSTDIVPEAGLWAIDAENTGQSGRGFQIELRHGTLVFTYYGYLAGGPGMWGLASGQTSGSSFSASLNQYRGGTILGGNYLPATSAGSLGTIAISFTTATTGMITLPGESAKAISKFVFAGSSTPTVVPADGLWVVDAENNGQSGRGFQIETHSGVLVLTYYGYGADGGGLWALASGNIAGSAFVGDMYRYQGGTPLGGNYLAAATAGSVGPVSVNFTTPTTGSITFPGEAPKSISKFLW